MNLWDEIQTKEKAQAEAIRDYLADRLEDVVASRDFGTASAAKRGRNPEFPYVPIVNLPQGPQSVALTQQIRGLAYATREEAVASAQRHIDAAKRQFAKDLCMPNKRALREHYGLPRNPLSSN